MRPLKWIPSLTVLTCVSLIAGCGTPPTTSSKFRDDQSGLFLAVIKPFGKRSYYLGSDDQWSYFNTKGEAFFFVPTYRKVETSHMKLRRTFSFGEEKPYRLEMGDF